MKTISEIRATLAEFEAAMLAKGVRKGTAAYAVKPSGRETLYLECKYNQAAFEGERSKLFFVDDIDETLVEVAEYIDGLPSVE